MPNNNTEQTLKQNSFSIKRIADVELNYTEDTKILEVRVDEDDGSIWVVPNDENITRYSDDFKSLEVPRLFKSLHETSKINSIAFAYNVPFAYTGIYIGLGGKELHSKGRILRVYRNQLYYSVIDDNLPIPEKLEVISDSLYVMFFESVQQEESLMRYKSFMRYNIINWLKYTLPLKGIAGIAGTSDTLYALQLIHQIGDPSKRDIIPIKDGEVTPKLLSIKGMPGYNKIGIDSNLRIWLNKSPPLGYGEKFIIADQYGAMTEATIDLRVDAFTFNQKNELIAAGRNENKALMLQKYKVEGLKKNN